VSTILNKPKPVEVPHIYAVSQSLLLADLSIIVSVKDIYQTVDVANQIDIGEHVSVGSYLYSGVDDS
jgi:hypothetical protein